MPRLTVLALTAALLVLAGCSERRARPLISQLSSPDRASRQQASLALVEMGDDAVDPLIAGVESGSDSLLYISAQILGRIGSTRAIPFLSQLTQRDNPFVRREAVVALGQTGYRALVPELSQILVADRDVAVRAAAAQSLALLRDTLAIEPLLAALQDTAALVRQRSLASLQHYWTPAVEHACMRHLRDGDETVRYIAAQMLGIHRAGAAVGPLCFALYDSSISVRTEAARALGMLGDTTAVESLIGLLRMTDDGDSDQEAASQALRDLTGLDYVVVE